MSTTFSNHSVSVSSCIVHTCMNNKLSMSLTESSLQLMRCLAKGDAELENILETSSACPSITHSRNSLVAAWKSPTESVPKRVVRLISCKRIFAIRILWLRLLTNYLTIFEPLGAYGDKLILIELYKAHSTLVLLMCKFISPASEPCKSQ